MPLDIECRTALHLSKSQYAEEVEVITPDNYRMMLLIRLFETEAERQYKAANIGGYCHLSSGQEAVSVGALLPLEREDILITGYRCHGFALARGLSADAVMAELFGREHGCAGGRGGSMHLLDTDYNFYGGWGIVAGQLPIATGLALGLRQQSKQQAVLCELGDGAVNMGAWHESLNLASLWNLPIVFLVVNNEYGMGTAVSRASAEPEIHKRASAYKMPGQRVDGDDLAAVYQASKQLLQDAREHGQPAVLEAVTYRYRGHSVADAGLSYRTKEEITKRQNRDPLKIVRAQLIDAGHTEEALRQLENKVEEEVKAAVQHAKDDSSPPLGELAVGMYASGSNKQFERMLPGSPYGEEDLIFKGGLGE